MKPVLHSEAAEHLQVVRWLAISASAMILVVHILDGPVFSYTMLWAYLMIGSLAWTDARGRGQPAALAVREAAASAWCAALLAGAYPPWLWGGI